MLTRFVLTGTGPPSCMPVAWLREGPTRLEGPGRSQEVDQRSFARHSAPCGSTASARMSVPCWPYTTASRAHSFERRQYFCYSLFRSSSSIPIFFFSSSALLPHRISSPTPPLSVPLSITSMPHLSVSVLAYCNFPSSFLLSYFSFLLSHFPSHFSRMFISLSSLRSSLTTFFSSLWPVQRWDSSIRSVPRSCQ